MTLPFEKIPNPFTLGGPQERVLSSESMHAVHLFLLSPEIVFIRRQAFDHEIMATSKATRGLCGLLQSAPKRMTALVSILQVAASNPGLVCLLRTFWYRYVERALEHVCLRLPHAHKFTRP